MGGGGGTPTYGLYWYVPSNRVWVLRFSVLKLGIFFDPFVTLFLVLSLDRVAKCENARLNGRFFLYPFKYEQK